MKASNHLLFTGDANHAHKRWNIGIYNFLTGKQNLVIYGANLVGNFG
jgi:hypothetical protein